MTTKAKVPIVLLCAASGTGLTGISDWLRGANNDLIVKDLEELVCEWYAKSKKKGSGKPDRLKMDQVARRPRRELYEIWGSAFAQVLSDVSENIGKTGSPSSSVVSLHLTWYNPNTSEFFSPVDISEFDRDKYSIVHLVILIDDIYDMYYRLRGDNELYGDEFMKHHRDMLRKLAEKPSHLDPQRQHKMELQLEKTLQEQVIELALGELLTWRRSEMIQAENIARSLGAKLTILGTKHDQYSLQAIVMNPDAPRTYLSHRISEHRRHNMDSRTTAPPMGEWLPAVKEVNALHQEFLKHNQILINPTAIDELRYELANGRGQRDPHLARRWPMPEPEQSLLWSRPQPGRDSQHTHILTDDDASDVDDEDVSRTIASSLAHKIYFEIAFRDHVIVENTPNLCVYRPFFCTDISEAASKANWSSGVKREIEHWKDVHRRRAKGLPPPPVPRGDTRRRIAFVHTTEEIQCRIRWLLRSDNYRIFLGNVRRPLERLWRSLCIPNNDISILLAGQIPDDPADQLSRSPEKLVVRDQPSEVLKQIRPAAQIALYLEFSSLNPPSESEDDTENAEDLDITSDQVALLAITEDQHRNAEYIVDVVRKLCKFFVSDPEVEIAEGLVKDFWRRLDGCFEAETGITLEQHVAESLGIDYRGLESLARQAGR